MRELLDCLIVKSANAAMFAWHWPATIKTDKLLECSAILVQGTGQMRSDFLCRNGNVWFSEMSPYPLSGLSGFETPNDEIQVYGGWDLNRSWFRRTGHRGWKRHCADALRRML